MTVFILWVVVTISPGHLRHIPMDERYPTLDDCEEAGTNLLTELNDKLPKDSAPRTYCTEQNFDT